MEKLDFSEFPSGENIDGYNAWRALVQKELAGKPYESIVWNHDAGFEVEPYLSQVEHQINASRPSEWEICQRFSTVSPEDLNKEILQALMGGVNSIVIDAEIVSDRDFNIIFNEVRLEFIAVRFNSVGDPLRLLNQLLLFCVTNDIDSRAVRVSIRITDIPDSGSIRSILAFTTNKFPQIRLWTIDAHSIHLSGGSVLQELTFALAMGNEWMNRLVSEGVDPLTASSQMHFHFATGTSYFTEIAKIRAFRNAWQTIVNSYTGNDTQAQCFIHNTTSVFLQTSSDHNNNLLRATTGTMSAIIGGSNCVETASHEAVFGKYSESAMRLARSIQHLLIEESYIDKVGDVARGSFYIESMTCQLLDAAWTKFQRIESDGGILKNVSGFYHEVEAHRASMVDEVAAGKRVIVGVNKYQAKGEKTIADAAVSTLTGNMDHR